VDDDEVIRRLIAANLRLEGFDVTTAVDGQDCLEKAPAIAPDVITLDVTMPRLDGWETALRLRKCALTSHIKIVLITARDHEDDRTSHRHANVDALDQAVRRRRDDPHRPKARRPNVGRLHVSWSRALLTGCGTDTYPLGLD
jgi:CheY-like chemotaxis protein